MSTIFNKYEQNEQLPLNSNYFAQKGHIICLSMEFHIQVRTVTKWLWIMGFGYLLQGKIFVSDLVVYNPRPSLAPLEITEDKCCIEEDDKRQDCTVSTVSEL